MWDWQLRIPLQSINFCIIPLQYIFCSDNSTSYVISHSPKMVSKGESKVRMNPICTSYRYKLAGVLHFKYTRSERSLLRLSLLGRSFSSSWKGLSSLKGFSDDKETDNRLCSEGTFCSRISPTFVWPKRNQSSTPAAKWEILESVGLLATYLSISSIAVWSRLGLIWSGDPGTMKDEGIS